MKKFFIYSSLALTLAIGAIIWSDSIASSGGIPTVTIGDGLPGPVGGSTGNSGLGGGPSSATVSSDVTTSSGVPVVTVGDGVPTDIQIGTGPDINSDGTSFVLAQGAPANTANVGPYNMIRCGFMNGNGVPYATAPAGNTTGIGSVTLSKGTLSGVGGVTLGAQIGGVAGTNPITVVTATAGNPPTVNTGVTYTAWNTACATLNQSGQPVVSTTGCTYSSNTVATPQGNVLVGQCSFTFNGVLVALGIPLPAQGIPAATLTQAVCNSFCGTPPAAAN